jgi:hypothetical protein
MLVLFSILKGILRQEKEFNVYHKFEQRFNYQLNLTCHLYIFRGTKKRDSVGQSVRIWRSR